MRGDAGISCSRGTPERISRHVAQDERSESTFAAYDDGRLAGTLSLRFDSSEGLAADEIFGEEMDALRSTGHRICEFIRLAVDASGASKPVLAGLFHTAYLYAKQLRATTRS
jgi:hypothetical protein